ncbi:uncharacterized protein LOC129780145 [Toxorhynchites rutilus septentrionalis]|uniref:uncharacterized protein LOC129780145 n=1 Tax=Toxorhynchites rutilus septentrionalis TaxID=329112 RepID=UPI002479EC4C|nr:uncharacterized protein LOC129780145 [Toxorhynchites rutilus septentrionalis]
MNSTHTASIIYHHGDSPTMHSAVAIVLFLAVVQVRTDPPTGCVYIENVAYRRFLFPGNYHNLYNRNVNYDNWERLSKSSKNWSLESFEKAFLIHSTEIELAPMYLYAQKSLQLDKDRGQVFTSAMFYNPRSLQWKIDKLRNGYYTIRNEESKEYLYAAERKYDVSYGCQQDGNNQSAIYCWTIGTVCTWKGKTSPELGFEFQWAITSC